MATLSWGKPTVEIIAFIAGVQQTTPWVALPEIKQDTAKLTTTKGNKVDALGEGGEIIDTRTDKNKYTFECEVFMQRGASKPIPDTDGIVAENYSIRLTPEDVTLEGWKIDKAAVTVEESWTSKDGTMLKYTFEGLKPATGNMLKPYTQA